MKNLLLLILLLCGLCGVLYLEARRPGPVTFLVRDDPTGVTFLESIPPDLAAMLATVAVQLDDDPGMLTTGSGMASGEYRTRFPWPPLATASECARLAGQFVKDVMGTGTVYVATGYALTRLGHLFLFRWEFCRIYEVGELKDLGHVFGVLVMPWKKAILWSRCN